jgi:hypothetical protein
MPITDHGVKQLPLHQKQFLTLPPVFRFFWYSLQNIYHMGTLKGERKEGKNKGKNEYIKAVQ